MENGRYFTQMYEESLKLVSRIQWADELLSCLFQLKGNSQVQQLDGWDTLYLDYKVEWPMGLLLTPQVMARQASFPQMAVVINLPLHVCKTSPFTLCDPNSERSNNYPNESPITQN